MRWLECRVPPPLVGLLCAVLMLALQRHAPLGALPPGVLRVAHWLLWPLLLLALLLDGSAVLSFIRRHTTVNPLRPQNSSTLVLEGFYRLSRNPMYLGMLCLLLGWALWLGDWVTLAGPLLFGLWIDRFQIRPEERALAARFGDDYLAYCRRVRRWL
ncbi:isoprenylcysteine carboxylmethyltransferase family protein [Vogesella sp. LIG4]|uniref:methyltransferase family protein n=1 Tax=Vogesella sp. LIG4 TaxID=1192162 RepID=UPI00081FB175|nr:isoprenylcysteine carboxylmethyltransferase family protein [Vogesella sp. LIG4]SCK04925.1 Protein-S-isoprenylcysteine O-methyltransferase Ste14 [Vogesella sp. LIG4]